MTKGNIDDFEIMAPVGSRESLQAAIQAGAGSVYFGVGRLNMRAHSANTFTTDDLRDIASTCAAHGIKTYLTVNTIIYDDDIGDMHAIVGAAKEAGISAVIASDMAVITYCRSVGMEVHLSTQLNISNIEALEFYARFADVAVLARELTMDQVGRIHREVERRGVCGLVLAFVYHAAAPRAAVSGKSDRASPAPSEMRSRMVQRSSSAFFFIYLPPLFITVYRILCGQGGIHDSRAA